MDKDQEDASNGGGEESVEKNVKEKYKLPTHLCINCARPFASNLQGTNLLQIDFLDNKGNVRGGEELSVLKALDVVFHVKNMGTGTSNAGMCNQCARVLSHIYTYFINLMELSQPKAPVCKVVRQFKTHFKSNPPPPDVPYLHEVDGEGEEDELDDYEAQANGNGGGKAGKGTKTTKRKVGRPRKSANSSPKSKSPGKAKSKTAAKTRKRNADDDEDSDDEPKRKRTRKRKSYAELRQAESERTRRARMSETPEARAIRLFKDAERKRQQRRLLKDEELVKRTPGEESADGRTGGEGEESVDDDPARLIGETLEQRTARLARDAECKRRRRALLKAQKAQGNLPTTETSESNSNSSSARPDSEVLVASSSEFNYESLLHLAGIGV